MIYTLIKFFIFLFALGTSLSIKQNLNDKNCAPPYSNCNLGKPGFINVHIVPHTHDDVGWLKTVDQYYYGSNNRQQLASVQYVLDTVIYELERDPNKRFVYVEMAYFSRWWRQQDDKTKQLVRTLVDEGRLEFVIGAWCMDDEATTYYNDMIDQQSLGLRYILKEFGKCARPRSAWQIDPFGHSREQGSLFAQFGFDGLFLGRIDYEDSDYRSQTKTREVLWQASANLGQKGRIFTGVLPNGYNPPPGFCFDIYCDDDPIMDDPELDEYNVDTKVSDFLKYTHKQAKIYKTDNLIMTMGSDFQFSNAHMWYKNLDKLIYHVNNQQSNGSKVNIFYSTPACYLYSLNQANETWALKYDDFFPYAHRPHAFWTGYFTSRAAFKDYVRRTNNYLQIVRQLSSFADLNDVETQKSLNLLEKEMGIVQHHDAVSGTERQHVANDYSKRLSIATNRAIDVIYKSFDHILNKYFSTGINDAPIYYCSLLNITECLEIENQDRFIAILYNPLPREIETWIRIPTVSNYYKVLDIETGDQVISEQSPVYDETKSIPERKSKANFNLVFKSVQRPLGVKLYNIYKDFKSKNQKKNSDKTNYIGLKNEHLELIFDSNGNLNKISNLDSVISTQVTQSFCIYKSMPGNNSEPEFQASGAYVFRPLENECDPLYVQKYTVYRGEQFDEIHQIYNEWISQTVRLYQGAKNAEFEWQVGPINIDDNTGKEVVVKFQSELDSNSLFYTDSNGREILKRKRDFRPSWLLNQTESISGNYYPVNSRIFLRDEPSTLPRKLKSNSLRQLTIVTDRSQGGSSIQDGSIELMIHRRTLNDDALGVSEPLNETGQDGKGLVIKGVMNLIFDTVGNSSSLHRELSHQVNNRPLIIFSTGLSDGSNNLNKLAGWSGVKKSLPSNLHLLTLMKDYEQESDITNSIIVRIEHFYEKEEDEKLSQPVEVNLRDFFGDSFNIVGVEELALGANMPVEELNEKLKWSSDSDLDNYLIKKENKEAESKLKNTSSNSDPFLFNFNPMEIRTFRLWYLPK